jgi:hypothetical protein
MQKNIHFSGIKEPQAEELLYMKMVFKIKEIIYQMIEIDEYAPGYKNAYIEQAAECKHDKHRE